MTRFDGLISPVHL